ncbi:MAG TPA: hypothetical protein VF319_06400 [Caldimonas sp.]
MAALILYSYAGRTPAVEPLAPAASATVGKAAQPAREAPLPEPLAAKPDPAPVPVPTPPAPTVPPAGRLETPAAGPEAARDARLEAPPLAEVERRTSCGDLLQEATLRRLTVAEATFFKKECR